MTTEAAVEEVMMAVGEVMAVDEEVTVADEEVQAVVEEVAGDEQLIPVSNLRRERSC